ncbi:hypothetical protein AMTRI_Chr11g157870 [Amborella trichopoda]
MASILLFSLLSLLGSSLFSSPSSSLSTDATILTSLKKNFLYTDQALNSWDLSNGDSICSWAGVGCERGRMVSLDISNLNLSGSVSPEVSQLDHLVNLSVSGNLFSGEFPAKISSLSSLRYLNISNNLFNGSLDWDFSGLKKLEVIDVYNNNFKGKLPLGLSWLKNLKYLDLGGNYFYGTIPPSYGNFSELEFLSLAGNDLTGKIPGELGNLSNLRELCMGYYNDFQGGIPYEFGNLLNLNHLDLSSCGLEGPIPESLGSLKLLDTLFLQTNSLSSAIPRQLGNLTALINLDLSNNALTGEIPQEFSNLKGLALLNLFMNKLHGSIPDFIAELPNLETLGLWMNNFTGTIPEKLGQNGKLESLDLSTNRLTGLIPSGLCTGMKLRILILLNNFLFGPIPESLGSCLSLSRVRMGQNYLNGSIPDGFLYLPELTLMELQNNYLTGNFSENGDSNRKPEKLGQLNLSNNCISGCPPVSLSNFSALQILLLGDNRFSCDIPSEIGELKHILKLDLSKNQISGEIPIEIGNCFSLTYLDLSQNQLSGQIPAEISGIRILNYLNLSRNHLSLNIPRSIGSMKSLTVADFSFNNFSGRLPESGQFAYFNATSFAGNPLLCGSLLNPCEFPSISQDSSKDFKMVFILGLLVCSLVFGIAGILKARSLRRSNSLSWKLTAFQKIDYSTENILECLKDCNVIGRGGAGIVYHGVMPSGEEIAVKRLLGFGNHHDHGFTAEIQTLGQIKHRNIVRLLAFCSNSESNLLVYEYMKNGSLGEFLHGKRGSFLKWELRYKIAGEAAKGLCYLHHDCSPLIVHRDVKSNNILLDGEYEAHVADFGLAKFLQDTGGSECMSVIAGSYGYIAPEYAYTLKVDEKSDVYSFGVVLLELITGHRPVGDFGDGVDIVQWAKRTTGGDRRKVTLILDSRLNQVPLEESMHLFFIAMLCVQENSIERPTMREVVQMLSEFPNPKPPSQTSPSDLGEIKNHIILYTHLQPITRILQQTSSSKTGEPKNQDPGKIQLQPPPNLLI